MAMATTCCLNIPSSSSISLAAPIQVPWYGKLGSWRKKCVVGMTCMIIGTETLMPLFGNEFAEGMQQVQVEEPKKGVARWGDKRGCPPWNTNSFEIIVPENLPRPSSRRKSEFVRLSKNTISSNPRVRLTKKMDAGTCFSM